MWDRWSHSYTLDDEDTKLYASVTRAHKAVTGDNCILEFFLKKSGRSSTAVPNYDFSLVLEISVHISGAFCELVDEHRLMNKTGHR